MLTLLVAQDNGGVFSVIAFERIKGGKPFDTAAPWFVDMMGAINAYGATTLVESGSQGSLPISVSHSF